MGIWFRNASKKSTAVLARHIRAWLSYTDLLRGMKKNENKDSTVITKKIRNHGWNGIEKVL